jgi:hypothetical protein
MGMRTGGAKTETEGEFRPVPIFNPIGTLLRIYPSVMQMARVLEKKI